MSTQYGQTRNNLVPWMEEGVVEYSIGAFIALVRIFTRCVVRGGPRKWQGDDWLILLALACYTVAMYGLYEISKFGINISRKVDESVGPEQAKEIELGSKWDLIVWYAYMTGMSALKGCILFFYWRLTAGLWQKRKLCIASAVFIGVTYIISIIIVSTNCIPFKLNWQVKPYPGSCTLGIKEYYGVGIMNILTDLLMLSIPLPLLWRAKFPLSRKIFLGVLLCGGVFVIGASFLRAFFSIYGGYLFEKYQPATYEVSGIIIGWALREVTVACIVVNAPCIMPLFKKRVWLRIRGGSTEAIMRQDLEHGDLREPVFPTFTNPNMGTESLTSSRGGSSSLAQTTSMGSMSLSREEVEVPPLHEKVHSPGDARRKGAMHLG